MKKNYTVCVSALCLFVSVLVGSPSYAQTTKADFEKAVVADFCDSFSKVSSRLTKDNLETEMGMMILPLISKYSTQIETEWKLNASDPKDLQVMGEKIGQLVAVNCPAFQTYIKANLKDIVTDREADATKVVSGKFIGIEGKPFTYLLVQNTQGKVDKFYWMEFFPGADKLSSTGMAYLNKPLKISYREIEIYQAAEKDYKTIKVITKVAF